MLGQPPRAAPSRGAHRSVRAHLGFRLQADHVVAAPPRSVGGLHPRPLGVTGKLLGLGTGGQIWPQLVSGFRGREVPLLLCGAAAGRALAWHTPASASSQALPPHSTQREGPPCLVTRRGPGPRVAVVLCFWPGSAHSEAQRAPSGRVGLGTERPQAPRSTLHMGVASAHSAPSTPCAETHLPRGVHLRAPRLDEGLPASDSEEPPRGGVPRAKCFLSVGMAQAVLLKGRGGGSPGCH